MEETELAQRRERGRMAQRAFRQRQITTIRELKGKNQELTDVIENVTLAAARFSWIDNPSNHDRATLEKAIKEARSLAGLSHLGLEDDAIQVERNHWPLISNSLDSTNPITPPGRNSDISSRDSSPPSMDVSVGAVGDAFYQDSQNKTVPNKAHNQLPASTQYNINTGSYFTSPELYSPAITGSTRGRVSPRLTYGVWFEPDRFIRVFNPPSDIIPYLGTNINTLAGAIYWAGLGYGFAVLKEVLRMRAQSAAVASSLLQSSSSASDALPIVTRLFGHSIKAAGPNADGEQILYDMIHARFTWRRQGYIPGDHPGADPEIPNKLFSKVVQDFKTIPFPTPTSNVSPHQRQRGKDQSSKSRRRQDSPEITTDRGVQDITEQTHSSCTTSYPYSSPNPQNCSEALNIDKADLSNWLTPTEIESYVRHRLNSPIPTTSPETTTFGGPSPLNSNSPADKITYSTFETAFQSRPRSSKNVHSRQTTTTQKRDERLRAGMLKRLVRSIADKGVCFGNSPRWRIDVVSAAVDEWMAEVEAAEQARAAAAAVGLYGLEGLGSGLDENQNLADRAVAMAMNTNINNAGMMPVSTSFGQSNPTTGITTTSAAATSSTQQQAAWYFPRITSDSTSLSYQGHGLDYHYSYYFNNESNQLGLPDITTATAMTTPPGFATTTTIPFKTAGYTSGGSSSSSSMYYGSESDGIGTGTGGIPEGMVF